MPQPTTFKVLLLFLVFVAFSGLSLVWLLLLQRTIGADQFALRTPIVIALYSIVCILGIVAVFYPAKCRLMFQKPNTPNRQNPNPPLYKGRGVASEQQTTTVPIKGHHPDCEGFTANRVTIRGRVFCASCSGLLIGAIAALAMALLFSLGAFSLGHDSLLIFPIGAALMLLGLAQILMSGYVKLAVNALFVVGSSIMIIIIDSAAKNLLLDAYVLGLIVFLLSLRIMLSDWHNKRTCLACGRCL
jgi:ABC-type nickel/cobalt efflux system permease component RcnA